MVEKATRTSRSPPYEDQPLYISALYHILCVILIVCMNPCNEFWSQEPVLFEGTEIDKAALSLHDDPLLHHGRAGAACTTHVTCSNQGEAKTAYLLTWVSKRYRIGQTV
jgi:hypothetical protein